MVSGASLCLIPVRVSDATSICRALGLLERSQLVKKESVFALQQQLQRLSHAGKSPSTAQQNVCIGFGLRLSSLYERIPQLTPTDSTALLEERTREVQQIKKGVHEVNALLQELNFFVFRQQSSTDSIENHVNQSVQSHEQTVSLLKKAARRQERLKKMKQRLILWMLLVALVLPAIVAIKRKARL